MKKSKADKRKAKVKARKQQAVLNERSLSERIASALERLCEPILPEYVIDTDDLDMFGRQIVWKMGFVAWNIAVTGQKGQTFSEFKNTGLNAEEQGIIQTEIAALVKRKNAEYSRLRTAIRSFSVFMVDGYPRLKVKLGDTFPELPMPELDEPAESGQNQTTQEEIPMKHSFYDVKAKAKVTADVTDFVSYGEGKNLRFAFKGKTKDGRNLTAFVSKEDWAKAKKK